MPAIRKEIKGMATSPSHPSAKWSKKEAGERQPAMYDNGRLSVVSQYLTGLLPSFREGRKTEATS
jgi:hypothetical protein